MTTADLLQAATADEEQLVAMVDIVLSVGNTAAVLLALRGARQRGLEGLEGHVQTVRPDLNEIVAELDYIDELPALNEDEIAAKFESTAPAAPSREEMLRLVGSSVSKDPRGCVPERHSQAGYAPGALTCLRH